MANWTNNNATYYINPAYLTFNENSGYGANLIQVSASSSCYISVFDPANGIDYSDADKNYLRWKVTAYNNKFPDDTPADRGEWIIYVRLEHKGTSALIVYRREEIGVHGGEIVETTDEFGHKVKVEGEYDKENFPYYYIRFGTVGPTDGTSIRTITYDTGYLTSDKGKEDTNAINEMWQLDKYTTPWLIKAKQWLSDFTVKGFVKLVGGLKFSKGKEGDEKTITDIKRSTDSDEEYLKDSEGKVLLDEQGNPISDPSYVPVSDETIPTTLYLQEKLKAADKKYIRKDQDDRTPFSLSVGGTTTAEGVLQVGKEFMSGLTGYGAKIDEAGQAELHSLFIRTFLEVPELRYNRITVRMGDEINSVAAGIIERVEPASNGGSSGKLWLKLEKGEFGSLEVGDLVMQIFSDVKNPDNNEAENSDDGVGNRTMKGFATVYFEVVSVEGTQNEEIEYKLREEAKQIHPYAMGPFVQRGNKNNTDRQTIIYQGIYPKPYTRYMKGVNQWEFTFDMIGMQLGDLSNLRAFGQDLSGYSAYLNNIYYTGFIFELTPQQKEEISAYSVSLSEYVGSVRVDSEGKVIAGEYTPVNVVTGSENVITGEENVVTGEYLLQTRVQAFKGETELAYIEGLPGDKQFTCSISGCGCTAAMANGVISILSVENVEYCYVKIETLCEGKATFYNTYQVKVVKDGASALVVDLDNEMDSVACDEDGKYRFGLPVYTTVTATYGEKPRPIKRIALSVSEDSDGNESVTATANASTGKISITGISDKAPDVVHVGIRVTVDLFGKEETREVVFTLNKIKQGEASRIYKLSTSESIVKKDNEGNLSVSELSCVVVKYDGKKSQALEALEGTLSISCMVNGNRVSGYGYKDKVTIGKDTGSVSFHLYDNGLLVDSETVYVVADGNAVKEIREWYMANGDKDTTPSYADSRWSQEIPELDKDNKYLWNYEEVDYTDPEMQDFKSTPAVIAIWTQDGKGVKSVTEWYQVNNNKDDAPAYPHVPGDNWVKNSAPAMTEDAKYLWNYEEVLWTDDSVTYTEPALIGMKGADGENAVSLSVSHSAISRNSLGAFDPATVLVTARKGVEEMEYWISMFGISVDENGNETVYFLGNSDGSVSKWNVELKRWSEAIDDNNITSVIFRAYADYVNNYNEPPIAEQGITFVQQGEVGDPGPMPRNRGKYDGSTEYFYNDEYRDYVWDSSGEVWIRQGRGVTEGTTTNGAIKGIQPSTAGDTAYWAKADRRALTAIDTALIDEADIAGFVFKNQKMVSRDFNFDSGKLDAKIILDGVEGYFKCVDADVNGNIDVETMTYGFQQAYESSVSNYTPIEKALVFAEEGSVCMLPPIKLGQARTIQIFCTTGDVIVSANTSNPETGKSDKIWADGSMQNGFNLKAGNMYTFTSLPVTFSELGEHQLNGSMTWVMTRPFGGGGVPDISLVVDSVLKEDSMNPVQNMVIAKELKKFVTLEGETEQNVKRETNFTGGLEVNGKPIVYNSEKGYWKLDGDLLVTGGVSMFSNDSSFNPFTITEAVDVDWDTIVKDPETGVLKVNPDISLGGGGGEMLEIIMPDESVVTYNGEASTRVVFPRLYKADEVTTATSDDGAVTPLGMKEWTEGKYVSELSTSGNNLVWKRNGVSNTLAVPYASKAGELSKWKVITIYKNADAPTVYKLMANLTNWKSGYDAQWGLIGVMYGHRGGNMGGTCVQNIVAYCASYSASGGGTNYELKTDVISYVRPVVVNYNGVNYLALKMAGSGTAREHVFMGYTENLLPEFIEVLESNATLVHDTEMTVMNGVQVKQATNDGDGNEIAKTYLKLSGGTMTGDISSQVVKPKTDNTYTLGTSSNAWSNLHTKKVTVDGLELKKSQNGVLFLDGNLVVSGGVTMYGTNGTTASSIWENAPIASTSVKGIASFDSDFFAVNNGEVTFVGTAGGGGGENLTVTLPDGVTKIEYNGTAAKSIVLTRLYKSEEITSAASDDGAVTPLGMKEWTEGKYLSLAGGTMTGRLSVAKNNGVYSEDGSVLISQVGSDNIADWDGLRELGEAGIAISNAAFPTTIRTYSNDLFHFRKDTGRNYNVLDGYNYSGYLPLLNGSTHATNSSVIYAADYSGTANQVLVSNGANAAPYWVNQAAITAGTCSGNSATATGASKVKLTGSSNSGTFRVVYASVEDGLGEFNHLYVDSATGAGYNPATNTFIADKFAGDVSCGHADIGGDESYRITTFTNGLELNTYQLFRIVQNGTTRLYMNGSGNFGIGTTSPQSKLHVVGTVQADTAFQLPTVDNAFTGGNLLWKSSSTTYGRLGTNTSGDMGIYARGSVVIRGGATSTSAPVTGLSVDTYGTTSINSDKAYSLTLHRNASNGGSFIRSYANNQSRYSWAFGTNNSHQFSIWYQDVNSSIDSQKMYLDSSGNMLVAGGITMYSDERKKTILNHVELSLDEVAEAPLIEHYYNDDDKKTTHVGSIAQYWAGLNDWFCKEDEDGFYTMEIQNAALASAISVARDLVRYKKEMEEEIRLLKEEIKELKKK